MVFSRSDTRLVVAALIVVALLACRDAAPVERGRNRESAGRPAAPASPPAAATQRPSAQSTTASSGRHVAINGNRFYVANAPFDWRGITAFALVQQIAAGREAEAIGYLDWAQRHGLTVVRVLTMAQHLFRLSPEQGRAALPRLLDLASARGLFVEVVALADTADAAVDPEAQVKAIGAIAAAHSNAFVEIANEPAHRTQRKELHDAARLKALATLIPEHVPIAFGSAEYGDAFGGGDYATYHFPRESGDDGWGHVLRLADGARLVELWRKPVVSDEPIGASQEFIRGRRDNAPERFGAAAILTRFAGMYATFHYEGGLLARLPEGRELAAFDAWRSALDLAARVPLEQTRFLDRDGSQAIASVIGARATFARASPDEAWLLVLDPGSDVRIEWRGGWTGQGDWSVSGARLYRGRRAASAGASNAFFSASNQISAMR
jgi:hypothetical protein